MNNIELKARTIPNISINIFFVVFPVVLCVMTSSSYRLDFAPVTLRGDSAVAKLELNSGHTVCDSGHTLYFTEDWKSPGCISQNIYTAIVSF